MAIETLKQYHNYYVNNNIVTKHVHVYIHYISLIKLIIKSDTLKVQVSCSTTLSTVKTTLGKRVSNTSKPFLVALILLHKFRRNPRQSDIRYVYTVH